MSIITAGTTSATAFKATGDVTGDLELQPSTGVVIVGALTDGVSSPKQQVRINANGYGTPGAFNTASNGDKFILFRSSGANYDATMGIGTANNFWFKSSGSAANVGTFEWYATDAAGTGVKLMMSMIGASNIIHQYAHFIQRTVGANVASATTITPTASIFHVTGTTTIATINLPVAGFSGQIVIIPDGVFATNTAGNIALASTSVVSKALTMTYDTGTAKWYPSY